MSRSRLRPADSIIYSHTVREGDRVVAAIDLSGRVHPSCSLNWDSVTMKSAAEVRSQIGLMEEIGKRHLVTAGRYQQPRPDWHIGDAS